MTSYKYKINKAPTRTCVRCKKRFIRKTTYTKTCDDCKKEIVTNNGRIPKPKKFYYKMWLDGVKK